MIDHYVNCYFCDTRIEIGAAINDGWIPSFWDEAKCVEVCIPTCPTCVEAGQIKFDAENGDYFKEVSSC